MRAKKIIMNTVCACLIAVAAFCAVVIAQLCIIDWPGISGFVKKAMVAYPAIDMMVTVGVWLALIFVAGGGLGLLLEKFFKQEVVRWVAEIIMVASCFCGLLFSLCAMWCYISVWPDAFKRMRDEAIARQAEQSAQVESAAQTNETVQVESAAPAPANP